MKILFVFVSLFLRLNAFAQIALKSDSVYISGFVDNYIKHKDSANSVQIIIDDIASRNQLTYRGKIKDDGTYSLTFPKTGTQDVLMEYNEDMQNIIVSPGDHIQIDFDADHLEKPSKFKGDNAQTNQNLKAYEVAQQQQWKAFYGNDAYARYKAMAAAEKASVPIAYKKFLTDRYERESAFLRDYLKQRKLSPLFVKWVNTDLKYEYLENLMRYRWSHLMPNRPTTDKFAIPESYYNFATPATFNDINLSITSHFGAYLHEYANYYAEKHLGDTINLDLDMKFYTNQPAGLVKDVILCQQFYSFIEIKQLDMIKPYITQFEANESRSIFKTYILNVYKDAVYEQNNNTVLVPKHTNMITASEADSIFNKITAKYAGKVVYVDFWATWCGPCLAEMPNSNKLHERFAGKDVVFLYLASHSENETWKSLIKKLNIQGEHYLLNNNDFNAISAKFQLSSIPRYLLLNKQGLVVNANARRPSDIGLNQEIESLLALK
jgi:thiol-disulfide isomerase/thioredoxin